VNLQLGSSAGQPAGSTARPPRGAVPVRDADDGALLIDLLGPAAVDIVDHVPITTLLDATAEDLASLGLGPVARRRLLVAAELARRFQPAASPPSGSCQRPQDFLPHLQPIRTAPVESLTVLTLNARLVLVGDPCTVASGGVMHVGVAAREVFAPAIRRQAVAIVLAHNHPSGDPEPSTEDRAFTRLMTQAGAVLGIQVMDHLIVTRRAWFSFREARYL
jgi:DNA repair protein RadC